MPTTVLQLIKGLGPGGAENLLLNQARCELERDLDMVVAYLVPWKNHLVEPLRSEGWSVHCLDGERAFDLRWLWRLRRLVVDEQVDVVHGHSPLVSALARLMLRTITPARRPRSVYTEHNEWGRHRAWTRRLNRTTLGLEDHVVAVSQAVKASMQTEADVEVLIHGIDLASVQALRSERDAVRRELGIAPDEIVVGTVANFRKEKAYDVMLDAALTATRANPSLRFVSVGQGPLEDEIRAHHDRLGLGERFLLLGYRDDATRVMSSFDVFTLSSHHEGLPVSLMDACALGIPTVATRVGGIAAALRDSAALLVEPGNAASLAAAYLAMAQRIADDEPLDVAADRFDAAAAAQTLAAHYARLSER